MKRVIIELYDHTSKKHNANVVASIRKAPVKIIHINVDIWQSKVSGEKFIGELFCVFGTVWSTVFLETNPRRHGGHARWSMRAFFNLLETETGGGADLLVADLRSISLFSSNTGC